jgi:cytochrome c-type biogenesis protein CcsB
MPPCPRTVDSAADTGAAKQLADRPCDHLLFLGYAAFAVAFAVSIMYLITTRSGEGHNAGKRPRRAICGTCRIPRAMLDELTHQLVMFGFLFLTVGIITGAVWAKQAWTRYWSWDPKETWSLITWFIYAALLHFRMMRGWRGKRIAVISIIGFAPFCSPISGSTILVGRPAQLCLISLDKWRPAN